MRAVQMPARELERRDWLAVALWALLIFATVPLARALQGVVKESFGEQAFLYAVFAAIAAGGVLVVRGLRRLGRLSHARAAWLAAVGAVYVGYAWSLRSNPVEAVHFVQYGVLGALAFRALTHRMRDASVYLAAASVGGTVGILDEAIQWAVPDRVWDLRDVWFNFFGAALVQVAIAAGIRPAGFGGAPSARSVRILCRVIALAAVLLGASLLNTPPRIAWYASRIPGLGFLLESSDVMLEYGHLYEVPGIGRFRSRLAPDELPRVDVERGPRAGPVLGASDEEDYRRFLSEHTPITDPFLHEARVHLFRRDRYLETAERHWNEGDQPWARRDLTVAHRENRILEEYFGSTLAHSGRALSEEERRRVAGLQYPESTFESRVSQGLVTGLRERHVFVGWIALLAAIFAIHHAAGRRVEAERA